MNTIHEDVASMSMITELSFDEIDCVDGAGFWSSLGKALTGVGMIVVGIAVGSGELVDDGGDLVKDAVT